MFFKKEQHDQSAEEFMQGSSTRYEKKPRKVRRYVFLFTMLFVVLLVIWSYFAKLDEVVRGIGKVVPSGKVQVIQHLEGGIVEKILVTEGQKVKKGQILMEVDDVIYAANYREGLVKEAAYKAKVARLTAEALGKEFELSTEFIAKYPEYASSERAAYMANKLSLQDQLVTLNEQLNQRKQDLAVQIARINNLGKRIKFAEEELGMTQSLYKDGAAARVEVLNSETKLVQLRGDLKEAELNQLRANKAILEAESKIKETKTEFQSRAAKELVEARAMLVEQQQQNISLLDRANRTVLKSPVDGIVNVVNVHTVGGTVKPGEALMEIVPAGENLTIEANISPKDIGFIHVGQKAVVKLTAYDFVIYGGLQGLVEHISADSVPDKEGKSFYHVKVKTNKNYLGTKEKPMPIIPGMTAQVDILTGRKSVLQYILKPLLRGSREALKER